MGSSSRVSGFLRGNDQRRTSPRGFDRNLAPLGGSTNIGDCVVALHHIVRARHRVHGSSIAQYEQAFAHRVGVRYAHSFATGRLGLSALLLALGISDGDEVLVPVPTHVVVANAVRHAGAKPVFVDCRQASCNINLEDAERRVTDRTKAVILQHTFGIPVDLDAAMSFARRHHLKVIEDCVHALGSTYNDRPVGSFGNGAFFSTEQAKTMSTVMGGMVVTDDPHVSALVRSFQKGCRPPSDAVIIRLLTKLVLYHLLTQPYVHRLSRRLYEAMGGSRLPLPRSETTDELEGRRPTDYEQRLSNAQAVLGLRQLSRLNANLSHRRRIVHAYQERLADEQLPMPEAPPGSVPVFVRYPVLVTDRTEAFRLAAPSALLGHWFTSVLSEANSLEVTGYNVGTCPCAEWMVQHLVNLPTHGRVRESDVQALTSVLSDVLIRRDRGASRGGGQGCP